MASKEKMETIEAIVDKVEDAIEEGAETVETVKRIPRLNLNGTTRKQQIVILSAMALAGATVSGGVVHFITKKRMKARYQEIIDQELAEAKKFYSAMHKKDDYADPADLVEKTQTDVIKQNEYRTDVQPDPDHPAMRTERRIRPERRAPITELRPEPAAEPAGATADIEPEVNEWVAAQELARRNRNNPYVMHHDEFMENEAEYHQTTLTWFEGDDVLADEKDDPIHDVDATVGSVNLTRFGDGSKDDNVVYVRNERLEMDFEVTRNTGKFTEQVYGYVEHSERPGSRKTPKFRSDRE